MPRAPIPTREFHVCSWNPRLFTCEANIVYCVAVHQSYTGPASGKHTKIPQKPVLEIRESNKQENKRTNKNPIKVALKRRRGKWQMSNSDMLPSASFQVRIQDNFCCPCALIYNPVSCKKYSLKSLLNELLVRSRDYTPSWKHKVYYSSTFSFFFFIISD